MAEGIKDYVTPVLYLSLSAKKYKSLWWCQKLCDEIHGRQISLLSNFLLDCSYKIIKRFLSCVVIKKMVYTSEDQFHSGTQIWV